ncbi:MAG: glycosyltransferase family 4 protein [Candidatus Rokubacteria bacterium]|nr:glycosyltransferase family 4 protein [Candidatus Rokubacteria bacterium]
MRIAVNASIVDRFLTGLGVYTVNMVRELARLHGDLTVYTAHPEREEFGSVTARRIWRAVEPSHGARGHLARLLWLQLVLPLRLRADRASILFSPLPEGSLFSPVPQVVVVHDLIPLHFPSAFPRQSVYFRYVIPLLLRRSRVILSDSATTREDLGRFYRLDKRRIHVVPVGYDVRRFHPEVDPEPLRRRLGLGRYILYVGNLLPHKNLARLIAAFSRLGASIPHRLVIAGRKDPRYFPGLSAVAERLGIGQRVVFLDYMDDQELPALYAGADVFVFPSLYEGFGLPPLEAMACGTPVVTSNVSALPEVVGNAALLVDPLDVEALAQALAEVLENPARHDRLRALGLRQVYSFTWDRCARRLLDILTAADY